MTRSPAPTAATTSDQVRAQLVTALELELIGPTERVLQALGSEARGLETEALDRLPSSWYPTGFLVPTNTDLALRCDDTADDDFAAADGVDLRKPRGNDKAYKPGGAGDDGGPSETGPAKPQLLPSSIGVSVLLPPGADLKLIARWGDYVRLGDDDAHTWQRSPRQEALALSHSEITSSRSLGDRDWPNSGGLHLRWHCRPAPDHQGYDPGTVAVTLFFTNERKRCPRIRRGSQRGSGGAPRPLRGLHPAAHHLDAPGHGGEGGAPGRRGLRAGHGGARSPGH
jgi:hypothetical protein